ncbi:MAG: hypothetical protein OK438_00400 [Thaumarchaeota archaeon]|nr:hypothetical protein [Nitrososphaerota archaeon]
MKWKLLGSLLVLPLLFAPVASAKSSQPLTLTITGSIDSSGTQHYVVNQVGGFLYASVKGSILNPSSGTIHYSLVADVNGLSVKGQAEVHVKGVTTGGSPVTMDGKVSISGMIPAEAFPFGCTPPGCLSAIPSAFLGSLKGSFSLSGLSQHISLPISLESPFLNPFGQPVVVATADNPNSIVVVTDYGVAKVIYAHVQSSSFTVSGTLGSGSSPVSGGSALLSTWAYEDLFAGTEREVGTIAFTGMTPSVLDASGFYLGNSAIPPAPTFDCTAYLLGIVINLSPSLPTTLPPLCTLTGFLSSGSFAMVGDDVHIKGSYVTVWDIPAVTFGVFLLPPFGGTTVTASVMGN